MILANLNGNLIEAIPNTLAICPRCGKKVNARCGESNTWHWAHAEECPYRGEYDNVWHTRWKQLALQQGLRIEVPNKSHVFDAVNPATKTAYEFQHSAISQQDLTERCRDAAESGYRINWIFDYTGKQMRYSKELVQTQSRDVPLKLKYYNKRYSALLEETEPVFGKLFIDVSQCWNICEILDVRFLRNSGRMICDFVSIKDIW